MRNPFFGSARPRFADHDEIVAIARRLAHRIAAEYAHVSRVILFGSFARGDYGPKSDLDLLVVLLQSEIPIRERISELLKLVSEYPTDIFPLTVAELQSRIAEGDPFIAKALAEGILLHAEPEP